MNKLSTQAKSQFAYMKAHQGKMIGTGVGITAGIVYGLSGKQSNYMIAGLAIVGAAAGAILGGMFDKPNAIIVGADSNGNVTTATANSNDEQEMSNAIGSVTRRNQKSMKVNRRNCNGYRRGSAERKRCCSGCSNCSGC